MLATGDQRQSDERTSEYRLSERRDHDRACRPATRMVRGRPPPSVLQGRANVSRDNAGFFVYRERHRPLHSMRSRNQDLEAAPQWIGADPSLMRR